MKAKARFFSVIVFVFFIQIVLVSVAAATIRIMPLGDSITFEDYVGDTRPDGVRTSYRDDLWYSLKDAGYDVDFVGSRIAGEDIVPQFDPYNAGFPGIRDDQIATLLDTGFNELDGIWETPGPYLESYPADIILLHIGTNDLDTNTGDVEDILDEIDEYEISSGNEVTVILALIINHQGHVCHNGSTTTTFNENIEDMAEDRITAGDKIIIVDMECGAGIDYRLESLGGDMIDTLHPDPDGNGYAKMADVWFSALEQILPVADAGADQSVDGR